MHSRIALLVSLGLGVLAVIMMYGYVRGRENDLLQLAEQKDVVVAGRDIQANQVIDEQMIVRKQVPSVYLQPKALADPRAVVGRVAAVPIAQGTQLVGPSLEEPGQTALAYEIPRGQRAVTLRINEVTGVAGLVRPGNVVDIFGTFDFGRPTGVAQSGQTQYADRKTEIRLMAQNVKVVAIGREYRGDRPEIRSPEQVAAEQEEQRRRRERSIGNVTILVEPRLVQELVLAQNIGELTLALRSTMDVGTVLDLGFLDQFGLLKVPIPLIPRSQPSPFYREFRGG